MKKFLFASLLICIGLISFGQQGPQVDKYIAREVEATKKLKVQKVDIAPIKAYVGVSTLTYAATTNIDFADKRLQTLSLTGNVTLTSSNLVAGREVLLRVISDASIRTFTFPGTWVFVGATPANIAASKTGLLLLRSYGATDANVVANYIVQP